MGLAFDVVIMQEEVEGEARMEVDTCLRVLRVTKAFYENYLRQYVEGRVASKPTVSEDESERLTDCAKSWLQANTSGSRPPMCLIGDGGTGKTSAAVALMCRMVGTHCVGTEDKKKDEKGDDKK
eukprot:Hpha_TRINITY_DN15948_c2_g5::TRINITY_DN15948_c2_g5_i7::g.71116::m.71116